MRRGSLKGFDGTITRVVKIKGTKKEFFIEGKEEFTFEEAIRNSWPFEDHDVDEKWIVTSSSGEDLAGRTLMSYSNTVIVEFI